MPYSKRTEGQCVNNVSEATMLNSLLLALIAVITLMWAHPSYSADTKLSEELIQFLTSNGFKSINVVTIQKVSFKKETLKILRTLQDHHIQVKALSLPELVTEPYKILKENYLFHQVTNSDEWLTILPLLSHIQVGSAIMISSWDFNDQEIPTNSLNIHAYFLQKNSFRWLEIIGVNKTNHAITRHINTFQANHCTSVRRLNMNYHGISVASQDLEWEPQILLKNCKTHGMNCDPSGIGGEVALEVAPLLNLTILFNREPTNDWGVISRDGDITAKNSSLTGVMGSVVSGESQLSISFWVMLAQRMGVADFAMIDSGSYVLVLSPKPPEIDLSLFLRPLTVDAWKVALAVILLIFVCMGLTFYANNGNTNAWSFRLAQISGMIFWLLLNAFYSGALTMFFSNNIVIPFNSLEEAIYAYPEWNLLMTHGLEILYKPHTSNSRAYAEFWHRVETKPHETVVKDHLEGLKRVIEERSLLQIQEEIFGYMINNKDLPTHDLIIATKSLHESPLSFMLTHNSPLTEAFSYCLLYLKERGILDGLRRKWEGPLAQNQEIISSTQMVLTPGQVILVFLIMTAAVFASLLVLGLEICFHQWRKGANKDPKAIALQEF